MDWERYEALVRGVLPAGAPDTTLNRDSNLVEIGLDSFGMVTLISLLEQEFEVELPDDALKFDTFHRMDTPWELVRKLRAEEHA